MLFAHRYAPTGIVNQITQTGRRLMRQAPEFVRANGKRVMPPQNVLIRAN